MDGIEETATMTAKGQSTVAKRIRDAIGADAGTKMAFSLLDDGRVLVTPREDNHEDRALAGFLDLLDKDIDAGRNVSDLPEDLAQDLIKAAARATPLDEEITGPVDL